MEIPVAASHEWPSGGLVDERLDGQGPVSASLTWS